MKMPYMKSEMHFITAGKINSTIKGIKKGTNPLITAPWFKNGRKTKYFCN